MMVGAHNTVDVTIECQVHMGGMWGAFCRMGGALPCVPGMVNPGAHYRCLEACGGLFAV